MSLAVLLSILIQVLLVIHCIKTGRNQIWIWVIVLLPLAGPIAYAAVEIIPDLFRSRATQRALRGVRKTLDPQRDLRRYESEAKMTGGIASRQRYADELMRQQRYADAIPIYRETLTGLYAHDADLMLALARAQFANGEAAAARTTLDELIAQNPDFKSAEGHLLYAQALEAQGDIPKALEEYQVLAGYYPGAEATVRYARLLRAQGKPENAMQVLRELLDRAKLAPAHYRRTQKEWLDAAEREPH